VGRDDLPGLGLLFSLPGLGIALGGQCAVALDLLGAGTFSLALDLGRGRFGLALAGLGLRARRRWPATSWPGRP
jgi:hypothetical protein